MKKQTAGGQKPPRKMPAYKGGRTLQAPCKVTPETKAQLWLIKQVTKESAADLLTENALIRYRQITQTNKPLPLELERIEAFNPYRIVE